MTTPVYAVTGASGRLGRLAVERLTACGVPPSDIVALVRTPGTRRPRRRGARRLSLLSIPSTAVVTVMLAGMGARAVTEHSSRAAWLRQARSYLRNADPALARLVDDRPDFDPWAWRDNAFGLPPSVDLFGALLFQITGQQLSVPATRRTLARVEALFGGHLPSATELMSVDPAQLRQAGLSWRKIGTLRDLAGRLSDGRLDPQVLSNLPADGLMAELTAIPGIRPWTVQGAMLLAGGRDVVVPGDLRVRKAVQAAYRLDHLPTQQEVLAIADKWRPYRSLATSYLFTATFAQANTPPAAPRRT
jgi:DNA-3-methyladenine glycosylase II